MKTDLLTTKQACLEYNIGRTTLWRWAAQGKIKQYKDPITGYNYFSPLRKDIFTMKETCYLLHISRSTLYRYMFKGLISPIPNSTTSFSEKEINDFLSMRDKSLIEIKPINQMAGVM